MRKLMVIFLALLPASTFAQSPVQKERMAYGYAFAAPLASTNGEHVSLHAGIGGEGILFKGFGIGGEIGAVGPGVFGNSGFLVSVNPSYHFLNVGKSKRVVPFVTGGVTLFGGCHASLAGCNNLGGNFGGGLTYWFKDSVGVRFEARDHVPLFFTRLDHFPSLRVGLTFRF
jgi:hypothetical protein